MEFINSFINDDEEDEYEALPSTSSMSTHATAGAMAGMMEHVVMYPLDSVKTRMQTLRPNPHASYRSVPEALYKMVRYEGLLRPIKGVSVVIASAGPAHALHFSCYEKMKTVLSGTREGYRQAHYAHAISGCLSTVLHDSVMNPAEVVKQRMQVYNSPYSSALVCMREIYQKEGFRAFYRSYSTSLLMNLPFQSIHFVTYEFMQNILNRGREYNPNAHMICGGVAGGFAAAITTPLDVCKTLINTQEKQILHASKQRTITGFLSAASMVYRCCGVRGYFQGMQARVLHSMPATALSWSVYEFFKYMIHKRNRDNNEFAISKVSIISFPAPSTSSTTSPLSQLSIVHVPMISASEFSNDR